jgi:hypothetical protein
MNKRDEFSKLDGVSVFFSWEGLIIIISRVTFFASSVFSRIRCSKTPS